MRICLRNQYSQIHNLHSNMDLLKLPCGLDDLVDYVYLHSNMDLLK